VHCTLSSGRLCHVCNSVCRKKSAQTATCLHALWPQMLMTGCMCLLHSLSPCILCHPLKASVLHPTHDTWMNGSTQQSCDPLYNVYLYAMQTASILSRLNNSNRQAAHHSGNALVAHDINAREQLNSFLFSTRIMGRTDVASCYNTNSRVLVLIVQPRPSIWRYHVIMIYIMVSAG